MNIKDPNGKYELSVDADRGVVYQKQIGLWKETDMARFVEDMKTQIIPAIESKKWMVISDLTEFKTSSISESIGEYLVYCHQHGQVGGGIIADSTLVRMQVNRASKPSEMDPVAFTNKEEAEAWLKEQGY